MRSHERLALLVTVALLLCLLFALGRSVVRRANATFDYPSYSSLDNSDLGLKAYHDALLRLGYRVERNFQPLHKLASTQGTILYAGPSLQAFRGVDRTDLELFQKLAEGGSHLVLLLSPNGFLEKAGKANPVTDTLREHWGVEAESKRETLTEPVSRLPQAHYRFKAWSNEWQPLHMEDGRPVMLQRAFGKGGVLLVNDLDDFTNRTLLTVANGDILTAILDAKGLVVFDESHLGVADTGTVAGLARAHRLQWVLLGFSVLATLYVWRSSISFAAPQPALENHRVSGQDAHSALSHLLAQSVAPHQLLQALAKDWNASAAVRGRRTRDVADSELLSLHKAGEDEIADRYNRLAKQAASGHYTESLRRSSLER